MSWSIPLFRIFGTQLRMHITFPLLVAFFAYLGYEEAGQSGALIGIVFVLLLFVCVILHEFGHAFAARAFGIRTPTITMLPIGGLARLERMPRDPFQELIIALAGPLVNVVIAVIMFFTIRIDMASLEEFTTRIPANFNDLLVYIWIVNISMVIFNMIPAFPMDGGRVLRAMLATVMKHSKATAIAAALGQTLAMVGGFLALNANHINPIFIVICIFIFMAAGQEANASRVFEITEGTIAADAMMTRFRTLLPTDTLGQAADTLLEGSQTDFPVMNGEQKLQGILTRANLIRGLRKHGPNGPISLVLVDCGEPIQAKTDLQHALRILRMRKCPTIPVVETEGGPIIGLLTQDNLGELIMVRSALKERVK